MKSHAPIFLLLALLATRCAAEVNFCAQFNATCDLLLADMSCQGHQVSRGCKSGWQTKYLEKYDPECECGKLEAESEVERLLAFALVDPIQDFIVNDGDGNLDACASYGAVCNRFLDRIDCPNSKRTVKTCKNSGKIKDFDAHCKCSKLDLSDEFRALLVDYLIAEDVAGLLPPQPDV